MYADCYVLTDKRTKNIIANFLDKFIPDRTESADEYVINARSNRHDKIVKNVDDIINYLTNNRETDYAIYWRNNVENEVQGAMCFFTKDGNLILGLYCLTNYPDTKIEEHYLNMMKEFLRSDLGYIDYESPPPDNKEEFLERLTQ